MTRTAWRRSLPGLAVTLSRGDDVTELRLAGDIDRCTAGLLEWVVGAVPADGPLLVDLSAVDFVDLGGLRALDKLADELRQRGTEVEVSEVPTCVRRVVELCGPRRGTCLDGSPTGGWPGPDEPSPHGSPG